LNDKELGLYYFNKLFEHYKAEKNNEEMGRMQLSMGTLNLNYDDPEKALEHFEKALVFLKESQDEKSKLMLNTSLARVYTQLKRNKEAEIYLDKAFTQLDSKTDSSMITWVNLSASQYYLQIQDANQAIFYGLKADNYSGQKNGFTQKDILEVLYKSYSLREDYKNAVKYFTEYEKVRDNLKIEETAVNVEKTKIDYLHKIKEQELELRNNQKRFYLFVAICGLVILLLVTLIIIIRYKNR